MRFALIPTLVVLLLAVAYGGYRIYTLPDRTASELMERVRARDTIGAEKLIDFDDLRQSVLHVQALAQSMNNSNVAGVSAGDLEAAQNRATATLAAKLTPAGFGAMIVYLTKSGGLLDDYDYALGHKQAEVHESYIDPSTWTIEIAATQEDISREGLGGNFRAGLVYCRTGLEWKLCGMTASSAVIEAGPRS